MTRRPGAGADTADEPGVGSGPRTGSDPTNAAQETAVLRAELRGLEGVLIERAKALDKALQEAQDRLDQRLEEARRVHDQRLEDRARAAEQALTLQTVDYERRTLDRWENHHREHDLIQEAVGKAEASVDKRLEAMNELRAQISEERGQYVTRQMFDASARDKLAQITANSDKLIRLDADISGLREDLGALKSGQDWLVRLVAGAVITAVIGIMFTLLRSLPVG